MSKNKVTEEEVNALLEAFNDIRESRTSGTAQSIKFKISLAFLNIYAILFVLLYILLKERLLNVSNQDLLNESFLAVFNGRAYVIFWLLAAMNISLYFNLGFRIVAVCCLVYVSNSTIDIFFVFSNMLNFSESPYFSLFLLTRPVFIVAIIFSIISYRSEIQDS